jgi:hypothetical protein
MNGNRSRLQLMGRGLLASLPAAFSRSRRFCCGRFLMWTRSWTGMRVLCIFGARSLSRFWMLLGGLRVRLRRPGANRCRFRMRCLGGFGMGSLGWTRLRGFRRLGLGASRYRSRWVGGRRQRGTDRGRRGRGRPCCACQDRRGIANAMTGYDGYRCRRSQTDGDNREDCNTKTARIGGGHPAQYSQQITCPVKARG